MKCLWLYQTEKNDFFYHKNKSYGRKHYFCQWIVLWLYQTKNYTKTKAMHTSYLSQWNLCGFTRQKITQKQKLWTQTLFLSMKSLWLYQTKNDTKTKAMHTSYLSQWNVCDFTRQKNDTKTKAMHTSYLSQWNLCGFTRQKITQKQKLWTQTLFLSMKSLWLYQTEKMTQKQKLCTLHILVNEIFVALPDRIFFFFLHKNKSYGHKHYFCQWNLCDFTRQKITQKQKLCTLHILVNEIFVALPDRIFFFFYTKTKAMDANIILVNEIFVALPDKKSSIITQKQKLCTLHILVNETFVAFRQTCATHPEFFTINSRGRGLSLPYKRLVKSPVITFSNKVTVFLYIYMDSRAFNCRLYLQPVVWS